MHYVSYVCVCVFLAQKIHISENAKEALEQIGSYHIVFRGSMEVKVNWRYTFLETFINFEDEKDYNNEIWL